jgi:hypothetical protein
MARCIDDAAWKVADAHSPRRDSVVLRAFEADTGVNPCRMDAGDPCGSSEPATP